MEAKHHLGERLRVKQGVLPQARQLTAGEKNGIRFRSVHVFYGQTSFEWTHPVS